MAFQNILKNCSLLRSRFLGYHPTLSPPLSSFFVGVLCDIQKTAAEESS